MLANVVGRHAATTRSNHETRNIGTGNGTRPHQHVCVRAVRRRIGQRRRFHGRRGHERHDDRISRGRHDNGQCERRVQQRRQRSGWRQQRTEPVRQYADQPLAQRFDPDAGPRRPIIAGRQQKPRAGGAFLQPSTQHYEFGRSEANQCNWSKKPINLANASSSLTIRCHCFALTCVSMYRNSTVPSNRGEILR